MSSRTCMMVSACLLMGALASLPAAAEEVPLFDGERAFEHLETQCDLGPRPPGSESLAALRELIHDLARENGLSSVDLCFDATSPLTNENVELCNIVVSAGPSGGERLWLGAHYDTRPVADQDPDPDHHDQPILGANDGASGVAVLMHLIEILGAQAPPGGVDLIFFDGEDSGVTGNPRTFCLGSARLAATWQDFGSPLAGGTPTGLIVLDMVGREGLLIPQEAYSLRYAPDFTRLVFDRAALLGLGAFVADRGPVVFDDHVPFLEAGIPAVDLIDFEFPEWHTVADTPATCSPESLRQVGVLVTDLIYRP